MAYLKILILIKFFLLIKILIVTVCGFYSQETRGKLFII